MGGARGERGGGFVREVRVHPPGSADLAGYPWSLPVVRELLATLARRGRGLELHPGTTFLVGENGCGKSTLVEAVAVALGLNAEGGSRDTRFATRRTESDLGAHTVLVRGGSRERDAFFLRAESLYTVSSYLESTREQDQLDDPDSWRRYGGRTLHHRSHGEGFLAVLEHRLQPRGLYLLDEPEAALSSRGLRTALRLLHETVRSGSQCVVATHSPVLLALPGARILQLDEDGLVEEVGYDECGPVVATRSFLADPAAAVAAALAAGPTGATGPVTP